jgi:hypothetical protein
VDQTQAPDPEPCAVDISGFAVAFVLSGLASGNDPRRSQVRSIVPPIES